MTEREFRQRLARMDPADTWTLLCFLMTGCLADGPRAITVPVKQRER